MPHLRGTRHALRYGGLAVVQVSAVGFEAGEIGDVGTTTLEVTFTQNVNATDYKAGVSIKVNSISQTISSATRQDPNNDRVHFVIAAAADVDDTVTWEYDDDLGDYADDEANPMGDQAATPAVNYIGSHLYYDTADDAVWTGAT